MRRNLDPWGVNIPFLILSAIQFSLGGGVLLGLGGHPLLMLAGSYSLMYGMFMRLFFPSRKYLPLHLGVLVFSLLSTSEAEVISSLLVSALEIIGIRDLRRYGSRFPLNLLVLISPPMAILAWYINYYWFLLLPLSSYVLGVNYGVFSANAKGKVRLGAWQLPMILLEVGVFLFPVLYPLLGISYFATIANRRIRPNSTSLATLVSVVTSPLLSALLGDQVHSFTLGVMAPLFFSCILYSTSRYNYQRGFPLPLLSLLSYISRGLFLDLSWIPLTLAFLYFLYLIRDNFTVTTLKTGTSARYLRGN